MKPTMTVREVAKAIGVSEQTIRVGIQQGVFHWGKAIKTSSKYTYVINRDKFFEEWRKENGNKGNLTLDDGIHRNFRRNHGSFNVQQRLRQR